MTGITVFVLPAEVNSGAYLVGAETRDTFNPVSYGQACSGGVPRGGCQEVTEGYLSKTGADVTWAGQVALGQPFSVRDSLWEWGRGRSLISGDGSAIANIIAGLFFDGVALLLLYILVVIVRGTSSSRSQRRPVSAGTNPDGVRRIRNVRSARSAGASRTGTRLRSGRPPSSPTGRAGHRHRGGP
jgi:hypothetical protein